ncbi:MAG: 6-phosphogluconolactonase [Desulfarculus sp.]|nr:6-phosphogluconolactonase [Desulfarculus sp.]
MRIRVFQTADELARATATLLAVRAARAVMERGQAALAIPGGATVRPILEALARPPLSEITPWQAMHFFLTDERCAPLDDPASNFGQAKALLFDHVPLGKYATHSIPVDRYEPEEAAARYQADLRTHFGGLPPEFDFLLLGVGGDGHVASLFPGDPILQDAGRAWAVAVCPPPSAQPPLNRVSLTLPVLRAARGVVIALTGAGKAGIVRQLLGPEAGQNGHLPASLVRAQGELFWFLDAEAAKGLEN